MTHDGFAVCSVTQSLYVRPLSSDNETMNNILNENAHEQHDFTFFYTMCRQCMLLGIIAQKLLSHFSNLQRYIYFRFALKYVLEHKGILTLIYEP